MDDRLSTPEELAQFATELTDAEVMRVGEILYSLQAKYGKMANNAENLDKLRDEGLTRLAEIGVLATFDPTPAFYGEPPNFEIVGKIQGHDQHKYGFDHERKMWEVRKATELGEDYLGQKEKYRD